MRATLFKRDALGFQAAFKSFLSNIPYEMHLPREAFYQLAFLLAMALADQSIEPELSTSEGRIDLHIKDPLGDDFVIEIKYLNKDQKIERMLQAAFDQIESRKYCLKFQGGPGRIWKTALVIARRSEIMISFEEAQNWHLEPDEHFFFVSEEP
jgi:hypothetical protein